MTVAIPPQINNLSGPEDQNAQLRGFRESANGELDAPLGCCRIRQREPLPGRRLAIRIARFAEQGELAILGEGELDALCVRRSVESRRPARAHELIRDCVGGPEQLHAGVGEHHELPGHVRPPRGQSRVRDAAWPCRNCRAGAR